MLPMQNLFLGMTTDAEIRVLHWLPMAFATSLLLGLQHARPNVRPLLDEAWTVALVD